MKVIRTVNQLLVLVLVANSSHAMFAEVQKYRDGKPCLENYFGIDRLPPNV